MKFSVVVLMAVAAGGTAEAVNYKKTGEPIGGYAGQDDWYLDYKVQTEDKRQKEVQRLKEIQSERQPPKSAFLNIFQKLNDYLVPQNKAI